MVFRLLENAFANQKIESTLYSCPQAKLSPTCLSSPPGRRKLLISPQAAFFFENLISLSKKGMGEARNYGTETY